MKLLYYLIALGNNHLEKKTEILLHNLNYIYNNINEKFSIAINFYDISEDIKIKVKNLSFIENAYFYEKKGVLTELFLTNQDINDKIPSYDYIIFLLDDVRIINLDIKHVISIKEQHNIEIMSPRIINSSHPFMHSGTNLTLHNFLEVYLLFLTPKDFIKFCSIHTIRNKWMWGVDFLFGYYKIKTGIINIYEAIHEIRDNMCSNEAYILYIEYLKLHTKYNDLHEIGREYKGIYDTIELV